jgi:hypothetical protein
LLVGLGIRAVEQGFSVQYFRCDELMTALKADAALPPVRLKRRKYMSTALLLIDELGFDPMSRQECRFRRSRPGIPSVFRAPFQSDDAHHSNLMAPRAVSSRRPVWSCHGGGSWVKRRHVVWTRAA